MACIFATVLQAATTMAPGPAWPQASGVRGFGRRRDLTARRSWLMEVLVDGGLG